MSSDPLVFVPVERWSVLKSAFRSDWPRSVSGYTLLETEEHIFDCGLDYGFKVYCPYGNVNNGIVAVNVKNTFYEVIIQCPNNDTKELEEALRQTNVIDWRQTIEVPYAPKHVMDCVRRLIEERSYKVDHMSTTTTFLLDKESPSFDVRLNQDMSFGPLSLEHLQVVDEFWPHRYPGSDWYFELLIKAKLGYGLFKAKELIAWVFVKEMGALGHLYTMENHRRKGYGELVLKFISNTLLKDNKYVVAFCVAGNDVAYNLYTKLGFKITDAVDWCTFTGC